MIVGKGESMKNDLTDQLGENYPDAIEELGHNLPTPCLNEIRVTTFMESAHGHDRVTW